MYALMKNSTLASLNLSDNQIGVKEVRDRNELMIDLIQDLNAAKPSFVTGGEGIAEMLLQNRTLTALDVSWNSIR